MTKKFSYIIEQVRKDYHLIERPKDIQNSPKTPKAITNDSPPLSETIMKIDKKSRLKTSRVISESIRGTYNS